MLGQGLALGRRQATSAQSNQRCTNEWQAGVMACQRLLTHVGPCQCLFSNACRKSGGTQNKERPVLHASCRGRMPGGLVAYSGWLLRLPLKGAGMVGSWCWRLRNSAVRAMISVVIGTVMDIMMMTSQVLSDRLLCRVEK